MATKRILACGDFHAGHIQGLAPPSYHFSGKGSWARSRLVKLQRQCWDWWKQELRQIKRQGPIHYAFLNGDLIDGRGEKGGGNELLTSDREEQCAIALDVIKSIGAESHLLTYGTPYHTGDKEDFERYIAKELGASIKDQQWPKINGLTFSIKHHPSGGSQVPHGRHTAIARDRLWNIMWNADGGRQPRADVILRSHVHYHNFCGGHNWLAMTLPALQVSSNYGSRRMSGLVDFGFVLFEVHTNGDYTWDARIAGLKHDTM